MTLNNNIEIPDYQKQDQSVKGPNGEMYAPVMQDQSNVNFNPQIQNQIQAGDDDDSNVSIDLEQGKDESSSSKSKSKSSSKKSDSSDKKKKKKKKKEKKKEKKKVKKKKKGEGYRVKSKIESFYCGLFVVLCMDALSFQLLLVQGVIEGMQWVFPLQGVFRLGITQCQDTVNNLLSNVKSDRGANKQVDNLRQHRPKPRYMIECQHQETQRDSKGNQKRRKVTTFTCYKQFKQQYWADWSPEIYKALDKHPLSAIVITKKLVYFDQKTNTHYNKCLTKFRNKQKDRDQQHNIFENLHIDDFEQQTLATRKKGDLPCQLGMWVWWLTVWWCYSPLQCLFWNQVSTLNYKLVKVISNKDRIMLLDDDGGKGEISSCSASDSHCSGLGLGWYANADDDE